MTLLSFTIGVLTLAHGIHAAAIASPALPKLSAGELDTSFKNIKCDHGPILDAGANPKTRWEAAKADLAWIEVVRNWNEVPGSGGTDVYFNYVGSMFNLWRHGNTPNCGLVEGSCDLSALSCSDLPSPGAWMIATSIWHIHEYWLNVYNSYDAASLVIANTMSNFVSTFAPEKEQSLIEKFLFGALEATMDMSLSFVLGPGLGAIGAKLGEEAFDPFKEMITGETSRLMQLGVDEKITEMSQNEKKDTLAATLQAMVQTMKETVSLYVERTFSGRGTELSPFYRQVQEGKWLPDPLGSQDKYDLENSMIGAFTAMLIPHAWGMTDLQPIVLMENKDCDIGEPLREMEPDATHSGGMCNSGKTFFLVGFRNFQCFMGGGQFPKDNYPCEFHVFKKLPGIDELSKFGLTKDDIIRSVYALWQVNGGKNIDPNSKPTDRAGNNPYPMFQGLDTAGLFPTIPLCDMDVAMANWKESDGTIGKASELCP